MVELESGAVLEASDSRCGRRFTTTITASTTTTTASQHNFRCHRHPASHVCLGLERAVRVSARMLYYSSACRWACTQSMGRAQEQAGREGRWGRGSHTHQADAHRRTQAWVSLRRVL